MSGMRFSRSDQMACTHRDASYSDDSGFANPPWDPVQPLGRRTPATIGANHASDSDQRALDVMDSINSAALQFALRQRAQGEQPPAVPETAASAAAFETVRRRHLHRS